MSGPAIEPVTSVWDFAVKGGLIMIPLGLLSVVALAIVSRVAAETSPARASRTTRSRTASRRSRSIAGSWTPRICPPDTASAKFNRLTSAPDDTQRSAFSS